MYGPGVNFLRVTPGITWHGRRDALAPVLTNQNLPTRAPVIATIVRPLPDLGTPCTVPKFDAGSMTRCFLAGLGRSVVLVDHTSEDSMMSDRDV